MSRSFPIIIPSPVIVSGSGPGPRRNDNILLNMIIGCSAITIVSLCCIVIRDRPRIQLKVVRKAAQIHIMARGINYPRTPRLFHKNIDKLTYKGHTAILPHYNLMEYNIWTTIYTINTTDSMDSVMETCKENNIHTEFQFSYDSFWLAREKLKSQKIYWHKNIQKELK